MIDRKETIEFHLHTEHGKLSLAKARNNFPCESCKVRVKDGSRIYQCLFRDCNYKIHELCGRMETTEKADHIRHEHKLHRISSNPTENPKPFCLVCRFPIEGVRYWCKERDCRIMVHPLCSQLMPSKLPEHVPDAATVTRSQVFHRFHDRSHGPLTYREGSRDFTCQACQVKVEGQRPKYECAACGFKMHKVCATLHDQRVKHKTHKHKLTQILEEPEGNDLRCSVCDKDIKGMRYACLHSDCSKSKFVVHPMCLDIEQEKPKEHKPSPVKNK